MNIKIIAEICINHNGSLSLAKKLILKAKKCGADAVKFQSYITDELVSKKLFKKKSYNILKKCELSFDSQKKIKIFCKQNNIELISSPFDLKSLNFLKKLKLKTIKIPSGEITNLLLLKKCAQDFDNVILSTGMSSLQEIKQAVKIISKINKRLTILHCVSQYPTPIDKLNLSFLEILKKNFKFPLGLSDHSKSIIAPALSLSLGSTVIEKHITLDNKMKGPDHNSSLNYFDFKKMVCNVREAERALRKLKYKISFQEKNISKIARKSLVAKKNIKKNELFSFKNISVKRPGIGISPLNIKAVVGKKSRYNFKKDELIKL